MKIVASLIIVLIHFISFSQQKQVCFTFDDLPVVSYGIKNAAYQKNLLNKIINSLKSNHIPAIGFVNEKKLYKKGRVIQYQNELLERWFNAGLDLGNHTYSHPDYNKVTFKHFTKDIIKGETHIKKIVNARGKQVKFFRHPYLHMGSTKAKADSLEIFLKQHNYIVAPVTIDNADYLFALAYKRAMDKDNGILMKKIGSDYITYMEKKLIYFEKQAYLLFDRNISQILLLHANALNSDYLDQLLEMFKNNNYNFVSMDEALKDPVYQREITVYGNWGISWIDRWALSMGKNSDFFTDDPRTPEYIKVLAN